MKTKALTVVLFLLLVSVVCGGPFDPRATFGQSPGRDLDGALKRSKADKKRVLLFYWNTKEKDNYPGSDMTFFMELEETKKLLKDNFTLVVLDRDHKDVKPYVSPGQNTEKPQWVFIDFDGKMLKTAEVHRRGDSGLKTLKELMAIP